LSLRSFRGRPASRFLHFSQLLLARREFFFQLLDRLLGERRFIFNARHVDVTDLDRLRNCLRRQERENRERITKKLAHLFSVSGRLDVGPISPVARHRSGAL
jgi:hypothetical protein